MQVLLIGEIRTLFNSIDEGFCLVEVICNNAGAPTDLIIVEHNLVFERQTGIKKMKGKTARWVIPNYEEHG